MSNEEPEDEFKDIKVKVEIDVIVDPGWITQITHYVDIFGSGYVGYWLRRVNKSGDPTLGQLVWEFEDDSRTKDLGFIDQLDEDVENELHVAAGLAWKDRQPLPPHYFVLNLDAAKKMWVEGVKKFGLDWYENGDANTYDYVIQMALLGECKYG